MLKTLSMSNIDIKSFFVWINRNFHFGLKNFQEKGSHRERKALASKQKKLLLEKENSYGKTKIFKAKQKLHVKRKNLEWKEKFSQYDKNYHNKRTNINLLAGQKLKLNSH